MSDLKIKFKQREDLDRVTTAFPKGSKCHYFYLLGGISFTALTSCERRGQIPVCVCTAKHIYGDVARLQGLQSEFSPHNESEFGMNVHIEGYAFSPLYANVLNLLHDFKLRGKVTSRDWLQPS